MAFREEDYGMVHDTNVDELFEENTNTKLDRAGWSIIIINTSCSLVNVVKCY